jgi:hypothetical protein
MRKLFLLPLVLCACTSTDPKAVVAGQLFCAQATALGPIVVALANAEGAPVVVTGASSTLVAAECAAINAIPVSPPINPASAPIVAAPTKL